MPIRLKWIVVALLITWGCQTDPPEKYVPWSESKKDKYATPEEGTYLKPVAYSILQQINRAIEDPDAYRKQVEWMIQLFAVPQKKILDTTLSHLDCNVPVRIYYPNRRSLQGNHPVVLFFHGGGFVKGSVEDYHLMVSKLAKLTGSIMVSVDYRLAPKHPFPAGITDSYAVLRWVQQNGTLIGADTSRIAVMGDSAGGNIATVLTLMCRDNHTAQPYCQVLIYPGVTFVDTDYPSRILFGKSAQKSYVLSESFLRKVKIQYMGEESNEKHPYLSPIEAELTPELAPAMIITAECDPLRDDGKFYAQKLSAAGVDVEYMEYSGMIHAFLSFHMIMNDALLAMKDIRDYLASN
jgi:acetyl esterase